VEPDALRIKVRFDLVKLDDPKRDLARSWSMDGLAERHFQADGHFRRVKARPRFLSVVPVMEESAALIASIAIRSDRAAFAVLFDRFAPRVKAYMLRLGAPPDLAEDIAQETMLALWRKAATFDPQRASVEAWIFTIARNLRIDGLRRMRFTAVNDSQPENIDPEPDAEATIGAAEYAAKLRTALASLPLEQAEVIRLSFFDDRPHAEIERTLGIPLGTVKSRLRLAMAKLRALLDDLQ
jgi:RNA polymerase sigma-70 factor (ECF subfamily)